MKKALIIALLIILSITFASCGKQAEDYSVDSDTTMEQEEAKAEAPNPLEGKWVDDMETTTMTIEGSNVLVELAIAGVYTGTIDVNAQTITIKDAEVAEDSEGDFVPVGDAVFTYEVIDDKIVMTTDVEHNRVYLRSTVAYSRLDEEE